MHTYMMYVCACVCGDLRLMVGILLHSSHLIHPGCISQSDPELVDMVSLASQLPLGTPSLPLEAGVTGGSLLSPRIYMGFWESKLLSTCPASTVNC